MMTAPFDAIQTELAPGYQMPRVICGCWQLSEGHNASDKGSAAANLAEFARNGLTAFDCGDIYTGVEERLGDFVRRFRPGSQDMPEVQIHTKYVPDLDRLANLTFADTQGIIDRSLRRLGRERLDMVQFHWWDFSVPRHVEVALHLEQLRRAGKINLIGVTNYDAAHLDELIAAGVPVVTNQVQYSLLDRRALSLNAVCRAHAVKLLAYGTVAGGFLSGRYLDKPAPSDIENRSLVKYGLIVDDFGGWEAFQGVLKCLDGIARRHGAGISSVASAYVAQQPHVAGVIIGARDTSHLESMLQTARLSLSSFDINAIEAALAQGRPLTGDVYDRERDRAGPHGRIMRYNCNVA